MARVATIGCTLARALPLEKIDDTLIKVIARVHDLQLALMFKVLDDLAARRNLLRALMHPLICLSRIGGINEPCGRADDSEKNRSVGAAGTSLRNR